MGDQRAQRRIVEDNLAAVRDRITAACREAGRSPEGVTLVAVTKYVSADVTGLVLEAGVVDLAESRPQSLWSKAEALAAARPAPRWHLVGHLQRNKVQRTLPLLAMLQTLDSLRLLEAIEADANRRHEGERPRFDVLVEVNLSDDRGRSGAAYPDVPAIVRAAAASPVVRLRGLMGMAGHPDAAAAYARRDFARLRALRDELAATLPDPGTLDELSMGMSGDFEAAILEGATLVRIGSALFEGLA
ncbi:MAG: YggS family pyridoxal phosphate-dependent enzyme [Planctomycetota bacterium]